MFINGMLVIRDEQMRALAVAVREQTAHRIHKYLNEHHADAIQGIVEDELLQQIDDGILRAYEYGFINEYCIAWFVAMCFEFSPEFHRQPWINKVLSKTNLSDTNKVEYLLQTSIESDWEEAALC